MHRNVPKISDRQIQANSVDPDQTAPRAVLSGSTLFFIPSTSSEVNRYFLIFRIITANHSGVRFLRIFTVYG